MPEGGKPQFNRQHYSLFKAIIEKICIVFSKITQHSEIRTIHPSYIHKGKIFLAPFLYLSRTKNTLTIGIYQDRDNQTRMISILPFPAEITFQAGCIKLLKDIVIQVTFVLIWKQIKNITWKQLSLIEFYRALFERDRHKETSLDFMTT